MLVKKFEAPSLEVALSRVKESLGPNALVLSTRKVRRRWYQNPLVEVTAARPPEEGMKLAVEFDEEELSKVFPHRKAFTETPAPVVVPATATRSKAPAENLLERAFLRAGISVSQARELGRRLAECPREKLASPAELQRLRVKLVAGEMKTLPMESFKAHRRWTVVGIAGAGKTSLAVKLAIALRRSGFEARLVGGDRRKVAAWNELQSYARLIRVPFTPETFQEEKEGTAIQIIDTPAFSFDRENDLSAVERICRDTRPILVLDATLRLGEALRIAERVERLQPSAIAFTRLDVAMERGTLFDILKATRLPCLGVSVSASFKAGFRFLEPVALATLIMNPSELSEGRAGHA